MKKVTIYLSQFSEYYLIVLAFASGYIPPLHVAPFAVILIVIFTLQLIFKNETSGLVTASLFAVGNLYFILAMLSELSEFKTFNDGAAKLLLVGLPLFVFNMIIAIGMIYKYGTSRETVVTQATL